MAGAISRSLKPIPPVFMATSSATASVVVLAARRLLSTCQELIDRHIADHILRPLQETIAIK